ncbi:cytochrome P450 2G1-like [Discoglossus pictus]
MDATLFLALSVPLFIFFLALKSYRKRDNLPPGPTPLPLLGNILHIKSGEIVKSLMVLSEKYGDVYTIYLGSRPVVIVTGYKTVKEILVNSGDEFLARGDMPMFDLFYKNYGVAFTNNMERWREMRRFSLNTMKGFGMGKRTTEEMTLEELGYLVTELRKMEGTPFNPHDHFSKANCHTIFSTMFGHRQDNEDEDINNMLFYIHETFTIVSSTWGQVYEMFPRIMQFLPGGHQRMFRLFKKLLKLIEKRVHINQMMLDPNNPTSYIDAFLIKMEKEKSNPKTEYHMTNLLCSALQIFFAGVETTSTTMTYSILILMKFPDVLAKVQEEIDRVIGQSRNPQLKDRNQMPYTDAVIHEIQRFSDLLPMGVPRKVTQDVEFRGYTIPKGTNVFPMLCSVLKDPTCFSQPEEFNPNNFLDENGEFKKNDAFMPFSTGKRNCLGEALVRMQVFLFLVTILQNFNLKSPVPPEELDIKPNVSGLGNLPKPYKLAFIPR